MLWGMQEPYRKGSSESILALSLAGDSVEHRVADWRILRLIRKWLKAGVSEDGQWSGAKLGTPQGAVASPLLANALHRDERHDFAARF